MSLTVLAATEKRLSQAMDKIFALRDRVAELERENDRLTTELASAIGKNVMNRVVEKIDWVHEAVETMNRLQVEVTLLRSVATSCQKALPDIDKFIRVAAESYPGMAELTEESMVDLRNALEKLNRSEFE